MLGSSGISSVSPSTRVWLKSRGGRLTYMSLPSVSGGCVKGAQTSPGQFLHQDTANVEGRKVNINELTISRERVCWGSSGISWASLSTRV